MVGDDLAELVTGATALAIGEEAAYGCGEDEEGNCHANQNLDVRLARPIC